MIWLAYLALVLLCVGLLYWTKRKNVDHSNINSYAAPLKVARTDFPDLTSNVIVLAFTSQTCDSCENVWSKIVAATTSSVQSQKIEFQSEDGKKLHKKYEIEAVPTVIICDEEGYTKKAYLGPVTATDLWAGIASVCGNDVETCDSHSVVEH